MAATTISRVGFGQVEPNHLSAQRTSQIYAQLPADDSINILENGQFVKYDYAAGKVDFFLFMILYSFYPSWNRISCIF